MIWRRRRYTVRHRSRSADETGAETIEVAEYELGLAHLRVPELV